MTPLFPKWRWFWWLAAGLVAAFLGIAGAGWIREKREVAVVRERHQQQAADLRMRIASIGDGISLAEFGAHLPEVYGNRIGDSWTVWVPNGYNEELGCPNSFEVIQFLVTEDGTVQIDNAIGRHVAKKTICFGSRGPWYYFQRAWHSALLDPDVPPAP